MTLSEKPVFPDTALQMDPLLHDGVSVLFVSGNNSNYSGIIVCNYSIFLLFPFLVRFLPFDCQLHQSEDHIIHFCHLTL